MPAIISCSRRTDIPAFYSSWFMNRLRAGYCHTVNPFGGQVYRVSLAPEDVIALAFWTRNPGPMEKHLDELQERGYPFFFSVTITGYSAPFEPHSPALESAIRTFQRFANRLSPERMRWRYDPIVLSSVSSEEYHLRQFEKIAQALEGCTTHCTFSFVQFYGKTARNMGHVARDGGIKTDQPGLEQQRSFAGRLAEIALGHGISFNSCCDDTLVGGAITKSRCIDPELVRALAPGRAEHLKLKGTRPSCGCAASVDIGVYDTCIFGCAYCYATSDLAAARQRHAAHDPQDSILWRPVNLRDKDLDQAAVPLKATT